MQLELLLVPEEVALAASPAQQAAFAEGSAYPVLSEEDAAAAGAALEADLLASLRALPAEHQQGAWRASLGCNRVYVLKPKPYSVACRSQ